jgi:hypothetical protein
MKHLMILTVALWSWSALAQPPAGSADDLWPLYKEGRFEEVVTRGKALLNTGNETPQVLLAVGRALVDLGRLEESQLYLVRAARLDPAQTWVYAWSQVYLGFSHARQGQMDLARQALRKGRDCRATENATRTAQSNLRGLGLDEFFDDWTVLETEHFRFHFSPRLAVFDREGFALVREEAFARISDWCGGAPGRPIRFFVWADHAEAALAGMPPLGYARPADYLIHAYYQQTVGHELTHVISHHALQPVLEKGLINEGLAIVLDQTGRDTLARARAAVQAGQAGEGETPFVRMGLRALWQDWSLLGDEYSYPIAGAWVDELLARGGKEKFLQFFTDQSLVHARAVYGPLLEDWIDAFEAALYGQG